MPPRRASLDLAVIIAFCAFLFYFGLGAFGLTGADEPRYAQIAREMLARHDWVTPILNGQPWLEKPILFYWQAMISYSVFGVHDWAARVPPAFDATVLVLAIYGMLRRIRPGMALDAALLTASTAFIFGFARGASTDMPLSASFGVAMLGWLAWFVTRERRYLAVFYVFLGLATLAKGPVAVGLAGLVLLVFILVRREGSLIWKSLWLPGMALWAAVTLPWYALVQLRTPQFFHVFFIEHNLDRYATNMFHHRQPFWYFAVVLLVGLLPWTAFAIAGFAGACRRWREARGSEPAAAVPLFLAIWAAAPVLFFSTSQSKLPGYILPAIAAWTMLAAEYLHANAKEGTRAGMARVQAVVAAVFLAAVLISPQYIVNPKARPESQAIWIVTVAAAVAFGITILLVRRRGPDMARATTLAMAVLAVGFVIKIEAPLIDSTQSARPVAEAIEGRGAGRWKVLTYNTRREVEYGLNFYLNRPIDAFTPAAERSGLALAVVVPESAYRQFSEQLAASQLSVAELMAEVPAQHLQIYGVLPVEKSQGRPGSESPGANPPRH